MTKAFSIEDGNLQVRSLIVSRQVDYSDLDGALELRTNGDLYRKLDAAAVRQSVKNIILTDYNEKPFRPLFGGNIRDMLFENYDFSLSEDIKARIRRAIQLYEPRALVQDLRTRWDEDNHHLLVTVVFQVVNTTENVTLNVSVSRLR
jgi:phage baseplate assembly protein W